MSVFNAFVLLLTVNFVITLSKCSLLIHSAGVQTVHVCFDFDVHFVVNFMQFCPSMVQRLQS